MADPFLQKSHYETIGVLPTALPREIKHKYRKLALAHHPDKGGDEALFKQIKHAAECLLDPKLRAEYDRVLREARTEFYFDEGQKRADAEAEKPRSRPSPPPKEPRSKPSDWWFHAMFSEIEEIYQETLKDDLNFGARRAKPKPFSEPAGPRTPLTRNRFRRPSSERLWLDRGLN